MLIQSGNRLGSVHGFIDGVCGDRHNLIGSKFALVDITTHESWIISIKYLFGWRGKLRGQVEASKNSKVDHFQLTSVSGVKLFPKKSPQFWSMNVNDILPFGFFGPIGCLIAVFSGRWCGPVFQAMSDDDVEETEFLDDAEAGSNHQTPTIHWQQALKMDPHDPYTVNSFSTSSYKNVLYRLPYLRWPLASGCWKVWEIWKKKHGWAVVIQSSVRQYSTLTALAASCFPG